MAVWGSSHWPPTTRPRSKQHPLAQELEASASVQSAARSGPRPVQRRSDQQNHLECDGPCRPLTFVVTGGSSNDRTRFTTVMEAIRVPRAGPGAPRVRPRHVLGPARSRPGRQGLQLEGDPHLAPPQRHPAHDSRAGRPGPQPGPTRQPRRPPPPAFDRETYKHRNVVERCFNRLKQWRGIATRYDNAAPSHKAAVTLASLLMWACHVTTEPRGPRGTVPRRPPAPRPPRYRSARQPVVRTAGPTAPPMAPGPPRSGAIPAPAAATRPPQARPGGS
ncbi:transposase [Streptomyces hydrogenans]